MNLNAPRLDTGAPLTNDDLGAPAPWPLAPHRTHDYTIHTAECADDDTDGLPGGPMAALMLVGLLVMAAAVVAALVIVVLGVAP